MGYQKHSLRVSMGLEQTNQQTHEKHHRWDVCKRAKKLLLSSNMLRIITAFLTSHASV